MVGTIGSDGKRGTSDDTVVIISGFDSAALSKSSVTVGGLAGFEASRPVRLTASSAVVLTGGSDGVFGGNEKDTLVLIEDIGGSNKRTSITIGFMKASPVSRPVALNSARVLVATTGEDKTMGTGDDTVVLVAGLGDTNEVISVPVPFLQELVPLLLSDKRTLVTSKGTDGNVGTEDDRVVLLAGLDSNEPYSVPIPVAGLFSGRTFRPVLLDFGTALVATAGPDRIVDTSDDSLALLENLNTDEPTTRLLPPIGSFSSGGASRPVPLSTNSIMVGTGGPDAKYGTADDTIVFIFDLGGQNTLRSVNIPFMSSQSEVSLPVALSSNTAIVNTAGLDGIFTTDDDAVAFIKTPIPTITEGCISFLHYWPELEAGVAFNSMTEFLSFNYQPGPDHSTDVRFQAHLNGTYFTNVGWIQPGQNSGEIVLPSNLIIHGENILELRQVECPEGVGSCISGDISSWAGTVCVSAREEFPVIWFSKKAPDLDFEMEFSAEVTPIAIKYKAGPRHCTTVEFDIMVNNQKITRASVNIDGSTGEFILPSDLLTEGLNSLKFTNVACPADEGCCQGGQVGSWAGLVFLYPGWEETGLE